MHPARQDDSVPTTQKADYKSNDKTISDKWREGSRYYHQQLTHRTLRGRQCLIKSDWNNIYAAMISPFCARRVSHPSRGRQSEIDTPRAGWSASLLGESQIAVLAPRVVPALKSTQLCCFISISKRCCDRHGHKYLLKELLIYPDYRQRNTTSTASAQNAE